MYLFLNDQDLIIQLKKGNPEAYKTVVNQWKDMIYNTVLGILQHPEDAEDITQDVFVQAFESIHQFKGESKLSTWLYRIAVTKSLDWIRKKKRKKRFGFIQSLFTGESLEPIELPEFHHPGVVIENKENASVLFQAIQKLPENQKVAFTLNKIEGLSYAEVAEILETSVPSIESLMHRAKQNLRKFLADYYEKSKD